MKPNIRIARGQPTTVDIRVIHLPRGVKTPLSVYRRVTRFQLSPRTCHMLASEAPDHDRTRIFAHYSLIGGLSTAAGALAAAAPTALVSVGVSYLGDLKTMLYFYAALGLLAASIYRYLPSSAEMSATVYFHTVAIRHLPIAAIICDEADPETALVLELV